MRSQSMARVFVAQFVFVLVLLLFSYSLINIGISEEARVRKKMVIIRKKHYTV